MMFIGGGFLERYKTIYKGHKTGSELGIKNCMPRKKEPRKDPMLGAKIADKELEIFK